MTSGGRCRYELKEAGGSLFIGETPGRNRLGIPRRGCLDPYQASWDATYMGRDEAMTVVRGGCLCGAIRYEAIGEPINVRICHCRKCQKAIGGAFNARALFQRDKVSIEGPVEHYQSSMELARGFCPKCGATLFSERAAAGVIGLTLASMDEPDAFSPAEHIWTLSRRAWVALADGLPQHPEAAP